MSNDDYKLQVTTTINGDMYNFRANTPDELLANVKGSAANVEEFIEALNTIKDAAVIKGVLTGSTGGSGGGGSSSSTSASNGGAPRCAHGLMKDATEQAIEKGWKNTHFCTERDKDKQCRAVNNR